MLPMDDRQVHQTAMLCHLAAFAGFIVPLGSVLGPLAVWMMKRNEDPFIDESGREAVNFQLSLFVYVIGAFALMAVFGLLSFGGLAAMGRGMDSHAAGVGAIVGIFGGFGVLVLLYVVKMLIGIIFPIIAALKADKGESYRYPLTIRLL